MEWLSRDVEDNMKVFGWSIRDFNDSGFWEFVNITPTHMETPANLCSNSIYGTSRLKLVDWEKNLIRKIKDGRWTALHAPYLFNYMDQNQLINLFHSWKTAIQIFGGVHFALLPRESQENALKYFSDGVLEFSIREVLGEFEGMLTIKKLKGLRKGRKVPFVVLENGITVDRAERIS